MNNLTKLRMKDVIVLTGLPRSTIHLYIQKGLLPKPKKTNRNQAHYDQDFVRRARLIKVLQARAHLPLSSIRETLRKIPRGAIGDVDPEQLASVAGIVADSLRFAWEQDASHDQLIKGTVIQPEDLQALKKAGLIGPAQRLGEDWYSPLDVRIALAFARLRDSYQEANPSIVRSPSVASPQIFRAYRLSLDKLARVQAAEVLRITRSLDIKDAGEFTKRTADARGEMITALYRKALGRAVSELMNGQPPDDSRSLRAESSKDVRHSVENLSI